MKIFLHGYSPDNVIWNKHFLANLEVDYIIENDMRRMATKELFILSPTTMPFESFIDCIELAVREPERLIVCIDTKYLTPNNESKYKYVADVVESNDGLVLTSINEALDYLNASCPVINTMEHANELFDEYLELQEKLGRNMVLNERYLVLCPQDDWGKGNISAYCSRVAIINSRLRYILEYAYKEAIRI